MIISSGSVEMAAARSYARVNMNSYGVTVSDSTLTDRYGTNGSFMEYLQKKDAGIRAGLMPEGKTKEGSGIDALEELRRRSVMYILNALHRMFRKRDGM